MDPSKFPTDNLYKFMALCGLVLIVACGYAQWTVNEKANFYNFEEAYYTNTMKKIAENWNAEKDPAMKTAIGKSLSDTANTYLERRRKDDVIREKLLYDAPHTRQLLFGGMVVGSMLTGAGFFLWYHKLQKHLDKAVAEGMKPST